MTEPLEIEPLALFLAKYHEALTTWQAMRSSAHACPSDGAFDATAAALATVDMVGRPSVRMVLVKEIDAEGFCFYTNRESRKGQDLAFNPNAALCFYWPWLGHQVRIEGDVKPVDDARSDAYFSQRPRESQLGAWASRQSRPMIDRSQFQQSLEKLDAQWNDQPVPRPPHWGGYLLVPYRYEFWRAENFRWHHRTEYVQEGGLWKTTQLFP